MRKLRILALMDEEFVPPESIEGMTFEQIVPFKTEYDVCVTLEELGHDVLRLGVNRDLGTIADAIKNYRPHLAFNLLEEFQGVGIYVQNVIAYLELKGLAYTGCNPLGLVLAHDKALSKKLLSYHDIPVPQFAVFERGKIVRRPEGLPLPLFVKSTTEEGSVGISLSSVVRTDKQLIERVNYIHERLETDAIAEQYIDGREFYVGVLGNQRLETLPIWELIFKKLPAGIPRIATEQVKWDLDYQKEVGVITKLAKLTPGQVKHIEKICKQVFRVLQLSGYARMDLRLTPEGDVYVLEANPNPQLSYGEDLAESAHSVGIDYLELIRRIVNLGMRYKPAGADTVA